VGALALVRNALTDVIELTERAEHAELALPNGVLAAYLAGAYLWLDDVADALTTLATELNTLIPDWSAVRHRLDEVAWIHDMLVIEQTRIESRLSGEDEELATTLARLFATITAFQAKLAEPFG
jgi:ferric-dicitrate binding protein FerR (iron transport regulator)